MEIIKLERENKKNLQVRLENQALEEASLATLSKKAQNALYKVDIADISKKSSPFARLTSAIPQLLRKIGNINDTQELLTPDQHEESLFRQITERAKPETSKYIIDRLEPNEIVAGDLYYTVVMQEATK